MSAIRAGLTALCCALPCVAAQVAAQGTYPSKPIRFIVAYTTGGLGDTFARAMGQHLGQRLGQPVVIENRPGASQVIALEATAKAPADGHTLVYGTQSGMVFTTASKKTLPYDPLKDFAAVGMLFTTPFYLLVHPAIPATNVQELIAYIKANPHKLSYASVGVGSGQHLAMELFRSRTDLDIVHVPYKGSAPASVDMISGQVQLMFSIAGVAAPHIKSGRLRALGVTSLQPSALFPGLPTVAASGLPGYESIQMFGLYLPAATPARIAERLNRDVVQALNRPEAKEKLLASGLEVVANSPQQFTAVIKTDMATMGKVIKDAGIRAD